MGRSYLPPFGWYDERAEKRGEFVDLMMEDGDAARNIIDAAKKHNADFIVLGHRGLGALGEIFAGSVSNKVSQLAQATVVSVK